MKLGLATSFSIVLCILGGLLISPTTSAAGGGRSEKTAIVSPGVYKALKEVEALIARKKYAAAIKKLDTLLPEVDKSSYAEAAMLRTLASAHALQGNYRRAAELLAKSIASKTLPDKQERASLFNLAQLYMTTAEYAKASDILEPWLRRNAEADSEAHILLANAYAQQKRYRAAIPHVRKAINRSRKKKEAWYQMLLAMTYQLRDYGASAGVLQDLIRLFPLKKEYWQQLSLMYQQLKQYSKALAIKRLAYRQGYSGSEKAILELVNLHLYVNAPYQGGKLLLKGIEQGRVAATAKNWTLLADAWSMAREYARSAAALAKASALSDDGELYYRLGRIHVEQENWHEAERSLTRALAKGKLKAPGNAYVLLGISYQSLGRTKQARQYFSRAREFPQSRQAARQWLAFIAPSTL